MLAGRVGWVGRGIGGRAPRAGPVVRGTGRTGRGSASLLGLLAAAGASGRGELLAGPGAVLARAVAVGAVAEPLRRSRSSPATRPCRAPRGRCSSRRSDGRRAWAWRRGRPVGWRRPGRRAAGDVGRPGRRRPVGAASRHAWASGPAWGRAGRAARRPGRAGPPPRGRCGRTRTTAGSASRSCWPASTAGSRSGRRRRRRARRSGRATCVSFCMTAACGFAADAVVWCWAEMRAVKWVATLAMIISGSATGTTDAVKLEKFSEKWPSSCAPPKIACGELDAEEARVVERDDVGAVEDVVVRVVRLEAPQHVEEPDEDRELHEDRQTAAQRVDAVLLLELLHLRRRASACRSCTSPAAS